MPQSPVSERGVTNQPEIILAKDIDIYNIARITGGTVWARKGPGSPGFVPDRVEFPQQGVVLKVGESTGPILEFSYQPRRKKFRKQPEPEQSTMHVGAVEVDEANNSVKFVHKLQVEGGHVFDFFEVTLKLGEETKVSGTSLSPWD